MSHFSYSPARLNTGTRLFANVGTRKREPGALVWKCWDSASAWAAKSL